MACFLQLVVIMGILAHMRPDLVFWKESAQVRERGISFQTRTPAIYEGGAQFRETQIFLRGLAHTSIKCNQQPYDHHNERYRDS